MTRRTGRLLAVFGAAAVLGSAAVAAAPAAGATGPRCAVRNGEAAYGSADGSALTRAMSAARAGDRLVIAGRCVGSYVLDKDLTLAGRYYGDRRAVLDGGNAGRRVLSVGVEATVTGTDLVITRGAGGVGNSGTLTLIRSAVVGNTAPTTAGGGVQNGGRLTLTRSLVARNRTGSDGGGIFNYGELVTWATTISDNVAAGSGGGMFSEGVATLHGSLVTRNTAQYSGGIGSVNTLVLDRTTVVGNLPDDCPDC